MKNKISCIIQIMLLLFLVGCAAKPSKYGTALDHMKQELRQGIAQNDQFSQNKLTLPKAVADSLMPGVESDNNKEKSVDLPIDKFNIIAEGVPAKSFFLGLVEGSKVNAVVHPEVSGSISLTLKEVAISEVLSMVERVYGYSYEIMGDNVKIFPATLQSRSYKVNYIDMKRSGSSRTKVSSTGLDTSSSSSSDDSSSDSDSDSDDSDSSDSGSSSENSNISTTSKTDFWTDLRTTLESIIGEEDGRKVSVSPISGQVVVVAMPDELRQVDKFLKESELTLNRQVILETKILEVELKDGYRSGINWGMVSRHMEAAQLGQSLHSDDLTGDLPITSGVSGSSVSVQPGSIPSITKAANSFGGLFSLGINYKKFAAFIELLNSQGNVQVLSSPRVSTTNNQKALIKVGEDAFFVTDVSSSTTATTTTTTPTTNVSFDSFFSGIALDVTPNIDEEGYITLHIHPTISTVIEDTKTVTTNSGTQTFPLAKSTIRESDSVVRAKNGELVVIGGLMQEKTQEVVTGVPYLMNLPFVGTAFRHQRQLSKKSELVILLRPIIVETDAWNNELEREYKRFNQLDRGFHVGGSVDIFGSMGESF